MTHPTYTAKEIANLLDGDPIMAAQLKEFLSIKRIEELLELDMSAFISDKQLIDMVIERKLCGKCLAKASNYDLIDEIRDRMV